MQVSTTLQTELCAWLRRHQSWIDYALAAGIALDQRTQAAPDAVPAAIEFQHAQQLNNALGLLLWSAPLDQPSARGHCCQRRRYRTA